MKKENRANLNSYVSKETKERFDKFKKESPLKNDAFINHLLDLYEREQIQEKEGKENDK